MKLSSGEDTRRVASRKNSSVPGSIFINLIFSKNTGVTNQLAPVLFIRVKEFCRWVEVLTELKQKVASSTRVIHVFDREGNITEVFSRVRQLKHTGVLVRAHILHHSQQGLAKGSKI